MDGSPMVRSTGRRAAQIDGGCTFTAQVFSMIFDRLEDAAAQELRQFAQHDPQMRRRYNPNCETRAD